MLKRTVILSLVGFSIFVSVGISLIFKSSIQRDGAHVQLVKLSGEVEKEILQARILIDDVIFSKNASLLPDFQKSIDSITSGLKEMRVLFTAETGRDKNLDFSDFSNHYHTLTNRVSQIEQQINYAEGIIKSDSALFSTFNQFLVDYKNLQSFFPEYLFLDKVQYRREIILILGVNFFIILMAGFLIIKLVNQLIRVDRKLVMKTIEVENRERERIAADLHDGLGSLLSGLIIHIQILEKENKDQPELVKQLAHLNQISNMALQSIEEVINNLNPSLLIRYGLIGSLNKITAKINLLGKTQFKVKAENFKYDLSESAELLLYRICSELINNALKHSSAEEAEFLFYNHKKTIYLEYKDNGVGFEKDTTSLEAEKSGLSNLIKRVESLDGNYKIHSKPGEGVHIKINFNER